MHEEVIIAGSGGQGVLVTGEILAIAGMLKSKQVAWMPEYGPATRGGTVNCTTIISDEEIGSTVVDMPSCVIVMNQPSLERFLFTIKDSGLVVVNSSLVSVDSMPGAQETIKERNLTLIEIDANAIAQSIKNSRAANLVMLGAYVKYSGVLPMTGVLEAVSEWSRENGKEAFLAINKKALRAGAKTVRAK